MVLEMLGVGQVIPVLALITDTAMVSRYPAAQRLVGLAGNPSPMMLVAGSMGILVAAYAFKVAFMAIPCMQSAIFCVPACLPKRCARWRLSTQLNPAAWFSVFRIRKHCRLTGSVCRLTRARWSVSLAEAVQGKAR